ncbi:MAG: DNA repair protein RecO [Elusimicrobiota bacterium]
MYYHLNGLVLNTRIQGEADKSAVIYTREWGKISAMVPGAKKIKAKLSAATEPVIETDIMVYMAGTTARPKVTGAKILDAFGGLKSDWRRFSMALSCAEIADKLTPFHLENAQKYDLLARTWKLIETAKKPWRIYTAFTLRFLKLTGYSFLDFLKKENSTVTTAEHNAIRQLALLSGDEVDNGLDISERMEKKIDGHMNNYLRLYIDRPLLSKIFWAKITS